MGGPSGGGTTTVTQQAPQLLPEGKPGYEMGQKYYQDILENPPIYEGPRVAPISPTQTAAIEQGKEYFGTRQPTQEAAETQVGTTAAGGYMFDPNENNSLTKYGENLVGGADRPWEDIAAGENKYIEDVQAGRIGGGGAAPIATGAQANYVPGAGWVMPSDAEIQKFTKSASDPYLRALNETTLPSIQSDFGIAGGGVNNTREQFTKQGALDRTSQLIATDVIAPIFSQMQTLDEQFKNSERDRVAAIASGDADRATRASQTSAEIQGRLVGLQAELETQANIERGRLGGQQAGQETTASIARGQYGTQEEIASGQMLSDMAMRENEQRLTAFEGERGRQLQAAGMSGDILKNEAFRNMMLKSQGDFERAFNQEDIAAQREEWAEPIQVQSSAANALFGASGMGPGGASSVADSFSNQGAMSTISSIVQTAAMVAMIAGKASCWIADVLYGEDSLKAHYARHFVNNVWKGPVATLVKLLYRRYGLRVANYMRKHKWTYRLAFPIFDIAVAKGYDDLIKAKRNVSTVR